MQWSGRILKDERNEEFRMRDFEEIETLGICRGLGKPGSGLTDPDDVSDESGSDADEAII